MWRLLCLLLFALPAWGSPFATANVSDPRATHCDYEDATTGDASRVPVVAARCRVDISHWMPGSTHAARMRSVDTATGEVSVWIEATLDRPAASSVSLRIVPGVTPPPSNKMTAVRSVGSILSSGTRTTSTLSAPSSIVNGDKLLAVITIGNGASGVSAPSITPPAGFTEVTDVATAMLIAKADPYGITVRVFEKTAASESGSYAFTHASASTDGFMYAISDAATVHVGTGATGTAWSGGSLTVTANGVTTGANDSLVIFMVVGWDGLATASPPTGTTPTFTERFDQAATYVADGPLATAGATGNKSITSGTSGSSNTWNALLIEIRAATGGGGFNSAWARNSNAVIQGMQQ